MTLSLLPRGNWRSRRRRLRRFAQLIKLIQDNADIASGEFERGDT